MAAGKIRSAVKPFARIFGCLALTAYLLVVPVLSLLPQSPVAGVAGADKIVHALAFFLLGLLADLAFPGRRHDWVNFLNLWSLGMLIEVMQFHTPYRHASVADLAADAVGLGLYFLIRPGLRKVLRD